MVRMATRPTARAIRVKWSSQRVSPLDDDRRTAVLRARDGRAAGKGGRGVRWRGAGDGSASPRSRSESTLGRRSRRRTESSRRSSSARGGGGGRNDRAASASAPRIARSRAGSVQRARSALQLGAGLIALVGLLGHQLANDGGEGRGHAAGDLLERLGIVHPLLEDLVDHVAPLERRTAGEGEVESAADAVEVAADVGLARRR